MIWLLQFIVCVTCPVQPHEHACQTSPNPFTGVLEYHGNQFPITIQVLFVQLNQVEAKDSACICSFEMMRDLSKPQSPCTKHQAIAISCRKPNRYYVACEGNMGAALKMNQPTHNVLAVVIQRSVCWKTSRGAQWPSLVVDWTPQKTSDIQMNRVCESQGG